MKSTHILAYSMVLGACCSPLLADNSTNRLTRPESLSGWQLLFDGNSTEGWRNYQQDSVSEGWKVQDGELIREGKNAGDLITIKKYKYFELLLDYKISEAGNSGLMFHVTEDHPKPYQSGPEIQIQDNVAGHDPQKSGWLYQLYKPRSPAWAAARESGVLDATRPAGQWNQIYVRIAPNQCTVTMNGQNYYGFNIGDADWKRRVAESKFANWEGFGSAGSGHICLQDHGNLVSFRSIKIRELDEDGKAPQPVDGSLAVQGTLAFPNLKWQGWEPIDESGNVVSKGLRILELTYAKGDGNRLFAATQRGRIYTFENRPDVTESNLFLDLQEPVTFFPSGGANEQGLLGLAMHPDFVKNGQFFVYYTRRGNHQTVISRFHVSKDNPNKADRDSEEVLLEIDQPFQNHNGGSIEFGPDGMLYVALGDGGLRNDPVASGQDLGQLLGSILRIDVDSRSEGLAYGIPADNPFVGRAGARPEIYAIGVRNPWRIAFDKKTGRLWMGDVGQELWEEVDVITKGGNYGWSNREGNYAFGNRDDVEGVPPSIDPVWVYDHTIGKSITGGRVFNSERIPELTGKYIYADYVSGAVWALTYDAATGQATRNDLISAGGIPVLAFGEDPQGEVYYMIETTKGDAIYRFESK